MTRDEGLHWRQLLRQTPRLVWLITAVFLLISLWYAVAVPPMHAPDEHAHVDLVRHLGADTGYPRFDGLDLDVSTIRAVPLVDLFFIDWRVGPVNPWRGLDSDRALPRDQRPTWEQLGEDELSSLNNHVASHPPLYYAGLATVATGLTTTVLPAANDWSWDQWVSFYRLLSALLVAPLPLLIFHVARRVSTQPIAVTASLLTLGVPQLSHISGAVNNDSLLTVVGAALMIPLAWIATGDRSLRTAVWAGALCGLAMISKGFGFAAPAWVMAAYAIDYLSHRDVGLVIRRLSVAGGVALLSGAWWPVRQIILEGTPLPRPFAYATPDVVQTDVAFWARYFATRFTGTFWGNFGVEQFPLSPIVVTIATFAAVAALILGLGAKTWTTSVRPAAILTLVLLPTITTLALVLTGAWDGYARSGVTSGVHGRYLFVALAGLAVVGAAGLHRWLSDRTALIAAMVAVGMMQLAATVTIVGGYWAGESVPAQLRAIVDWAPWAPRTTGLLWLLTAGCVIALCVSILRPHTRVSD